MITNVALADTSITLHIMTWEQSRTRLLETFKFIIGCGSESHSVVSNSLWFHGILLARTLECLAFSFSRGSSQPRDPTDVSLIAGRLFTSLATGKPQNTGVGSLSLLQGIFPTQGSNPGLPHCRQTLYQLSHKGSPERCKEFINKE